MTHAGNLTHRHVSELEEGLSERDRSIVETISTVGLATGEQLRQLFFSKANSMSSSRRIAQQSLRRLVHAGVLARLDRRIGGVRSGSSGYVYTLGRAGQLIRDRWAGRTGQRSRRPHEPGAQFVAHRLACTQLFVDLRLAERKGDLTLTAYLGEPGCWRQRVGPFGSPVTLKPDGYAQIDTGGRSLHWFIEIDRATESRAVIERKGRAYFDHYVSGAEPDVMPRVIWIAPTSERAAQLTDALQRVSGSAPTLHVCCATNQALQIMKGELT